MGQNEFDGPSVFAKFTVIELSNCSGSSDFVFCELFCIVAIYIQVKHLSIGYQALQEKKWELLFVRLAKESGNVAIDEEPRVRRYLGTLVH